MMIDGLYSYFLLNLTFCVIFKDQAYRHSRMSSLSRYSLAWMEHIGIYLSLLAMHRQQQAVVVGLVAIVPF
jgi:hypothetical protein